MLQDKNLDTHHHLDYLYNVAKGNILEIGVHCGVSTTAFLAGLEVVGGHLWSIDTHPACRYVHYGHPQWTFCCPWAGDIPSPELPLDVLFIDGDHSYEGCMADLNTWGHLSNLILVHDANSASFPGVRQAIDEYAHDHSLKHKLRPESNGLEIMWH